MEFEKYLPEHEVFAQDEHINRPFVHNLGLPENATDEEVKSAIDWLFLEQSIRFNDQLVMPIIYKRIGVPENANVIKRREAFFEDFQRSFLKK